MFRGLVVFWGYGLGCRCLGIWAFNFRILVLDLGLRVWGFGLGCRVWGLGFSRLREYIGFGV